MLLVVALSIFAIGSYLVWPSRWNVPAHINLGFALTAYVIPILLTKCLDAYSRPLLWFYQSLHEIGAGLFIIGIVIGGALPRLKFFDRPFSFTAMDEFELTSFVSRRVIWLSLISIAGMIVSFSIMGFVPMFVSDPMVAKYLRGSYQHSYRQVAVLFRGSEQIILVTLPIIVVLFYVTRRWVFVLLGLLQSVLQAMTLNRGMFGIPILMGLGLIAASRGLKASIFYVLLMCFGVAAATATTYYAAKLLTPQLINDDTSTVWENIALGAPDVPEDLNFLEAFDNHPTWTYGRTFVGGLIPFQYHWSPTVWSLWTEAGDPHTDIDMVVSGGLRLLAPVMGYTAFGWGGMAIVCLLSGVVAGYGAMFGRAYIGSGSLLSSIIALTLYNTVIVQAIGWYNLSIYNIFAIMIALLFTYTGRGRTGMRARSQ